MDSLTLASTVIPAVISVLIALAIGAVGYVIAAFNEGKRWQRQQRVRSYIQLTKVHHEFLEQMRQLASSVIEYQEKYPDRDNMERSKAIEHNSFAGQHNEAISNLERLSVTLQRSHAESELLATEKAVDLLNVYIARTNDWSESSGMGLGTMDQEALQLQAWEAFLDQAQRDLGLKHWWNRRP